MAAGIKPGPRLSALSVENPSTENAMQKSLKVASLAIVAAATLQACGGDSSPAPIPVAQCNGTPRAAVVYAGADPFPTLSAVPNACTIVAAGDIGAALDAVRQAAGLPRAHVVAVGDRASQVLDLVGQRPGDFDTLTLWLMSHDAGAVRMAGRVSTTYLNGGPTCEAVAAAVRAQGTPGVCAPAAAFDGAVALRQLGLQP